MRQLIPDSEVPGRYEVSAYVGSKVETPHTWSRRRDAEENAADILALGYSERFARRYDRVQVTDQLNRTMIYLSAQPRKRYGVTR